MTKAKLIALAAIASFATGTVAAQGMPSTPSSAGPSSSSPSSASPSSGSTASGTSGYLSSPGSSSSASASTGGFTGLDKDHDGMLTKAEVRKDKDLGKEFDTLDTNRDGKLDDAEFSMFETGSPSHSASENSSVNNPKK